jgi:hypothetical protein
MSQNISNQNISNQNIGETVIVPDLLSGITIGTLQADYLLNGRDYEHLRSGKPITFNWANSILLTSVGMGLSLLGRFLSQKFDPSIVIHWGEWVALGIGFAVSIILYLIGFALPDDRKTMMKKLKNHFDSSPKKRQIMQGDEQ